MPRAHPEKCRSVNLIDQDHLVVSEQLNVTTNNHDSNDQTGDETVPPIHPTMTGADTGTFELSQTPRNVDYLIPISITLGISRRGRKRKGPDWKRTKAELFCDAISDYIHNLQHLSSPSESSPVRVIHFYRDNRSFAYASAHIVYKVGNNIM